MRLRASKNGALTAAGFTALLCAAAHGADLAHARGIEALRVHMRQMNRLMFEQTLTELELDRIRRVHADDIARLAGALADAAVDLVGSDEDALPDQAERSRFLERARRLAQEAATLSQVAADGDFGEIASQIERVGHACAGCHVEFRPGPAD